MNQLHFDAKIKEVIQGFGNIKIIGIGHFLVKDAKKFPK